jgi:hypothetical protein
VAEDPDHPRGAAIPRDLPVFALRQGLADPIFQRR